MKRIALLGTLLATTVLAGCGGVIAQADRETGKTETSAATRLEEAARPLPAADVSAIKVHDGVFMGATSRRIDYGDPLPRSVESETSISLVFASPKTLNEIASLITETSKIPVVVALDDPNTRSQNAAAPGPNAGNGQSADQGFQEAIASMQPSARGRTQDRPFTTAAADASRMKVEFQGPLSRFLNLVSAHFNVGWRHEQGRITIQRTVSRTFDLPALPSIAEMTFEVDSQAKAASGQSEGAKDEAKTGISSKSELKLDLWKEVNDTLKNIIGNNGSFTVSKTTGTVTVTTSPDSMDRVTEYLSAVNKRISKQIALNVQVLRVVLNDSDQYGLDVKGLFGTTASGGLSFGNFGKDMFPMPAADNGGSSIGWALVDPSSRWAKTGAILKALSEKGKVSVVTSASVTTINGVPAPLQVGNVRDYVSGRKVTTPATTGGAVQASIETSKVTTGFNLNLIPRVLGDGDILLQYGVSISELVGRSDGFEEYKDDQGNLVMLANKNQRNFVQQAMLPNKGTLVLAGFEQVRSESRKSGTGHPDFFLLGGSNSGQVDREVIVVLITPTLLDMNRARPAN